MHDRRARVLIISLLIGGSSAWASVISLEVQSTPAVVDDTLNLSVVVTNHGDEPACNVDVERRMPDRLDALEEQFEFKIRALPPIERAGGEEHLVVASRPGGHLARIDPPGAGVQQLDLDAAAFQKGGAIEEIQRGPRSIDPVALLTDVTVPARVDQEYLHVADEVPGASDVITAICLFARHRLKNKYGLLPMSDLLLDVFKLNQRQG